MKYIPYMHLLAQQDSEVHSEKMNYLFFWLSILNYHYQCYLADSLKMDTGRLLKMHEILHEASTLTLAKLMHVLFLIYKKNKALIMFKTNSNHDLPIYHTMNLLHTCLNSVGNHGSVKNEEDKGNYI
jgi:hypothetical protein